MQQNYSKAQFFGQLSDLIENWLFTSFNSLAEQNTALIRELCDILGLQKQFYSSSENPSSKLRSERVFELLRWSGADFYYCANGSFDYMFEEGIFPIADTEVFFQDFKTEPYDQVGSPEKFVPSLSVLDALFNVGPEATGELIRSGTKKWITWDEMVKKRSAQGE